MELNESARDTGPDKTTEPQPGREKEGSKALYAEFDSDRQTTSAMSRAACRQDSSRQEDSMAAGYGIVPPYMLEYLAKQEGDRNGFASTYSKTLAMQKQLLLDEPLEEPAGCQRAPQGTRDELCESRAAGRACSVRLTADTMQVQPRLSEDFQGAREVYDAKAGELLPGDKARFEGDPPSGDTDVDNVYDLTGIVRDFYRREYNRNSIDGQGMKFVSTANYGENYQNAFWNSTQMVYGHPGAKSPFKTFALLDIAGHEITHGVTEKEVNFRYWGQSGALNESMSDVFGELIEQYARNQNADEADWLIGEGILKEGVNGRALRDMLHPGTAYDDRRLGGKDPQPDNMKDYKQVKTDNAGVHINSGIPNRAFALFALAVGGHAWDDPGQIWFEARKHSGNSPSFASFAYQTIDAAKKIAHQPDTVQKLEKAWADVGVTPAVWAVHNGTQEQTQQQNLVKGQRDLNPSKAG
jgi:hypothetical protein